MIDKAGEYVQLYLTELFEILIDMAPWLIMGFLIAGILHVFFPQGKINKLLGATNTRSVFMAALFGVPLPLCSCGVIPTGVSIHKSGASKGSAVSFLISTPQTGVDSIMVTYSLLGLPFAIIRPIVAFITGIVGGIITNKVEPAKDNDKSSTITVTEQKIKNPVKEILRYAFVDFLADIAKWLVIGLAIAALIAVFVPDDFFASYIKSDFLGMLIILVASIPVYVCATSSVPIAAVLLLKGISPGAALVFLMAGPATNAATISVIGNSMGRKTLFAYLFTISAGAMLFGWIIDAFLPREWFTLLSGEHMHHEHGLLPRWLMISSGMVMIAAILNIFIRKWIKKLKPATKKTVSPVIEEKPSATGFDFSNLKNVKIDTMKEEVVTIKGMNCSHCKANVENAVMKIAGIKSITADVDKEQAVISGENIDLDEVKKAVEDIGYKFIGS